VLVIALRFTAEAQTSLKRPSEESEWLHGFVVPTLVPGLRECNL